MANGTEQAVYKGVALTLLLAVLAVVLWPVFPDGSRVAAPRAACLSNMKQLGLGIALYMADHDDILPVAQSSVGPTAVGWGGRIYPYTKSPDVYTDRTEVKDLRNSERERPRVSYALNANAAAIPDVVVRAPANLSRMVLLFEISGARQGRGGELASTLALSPAGDGAAGGLLDSVDPNVEPLASSATGPLDNSGLDPKSPTRHGGKSNFVFLDTSARALSPPQVSAGANAARPKDLQASTGCRRPDLPGISRPCAAGAEGKMKPLTFSLR